MERIFLLGDSVRMGYDRAVRDHFAGRAEVYYPRDNCRFAAYLLRHCPEWIEAECDPQTVTLVHFNAGLWDTGRYLFEDVPFTPLEEYIALLRRIVEKLRHICPKAKLIFATSTPVQPQRYDVKRFMRYNEDIAAYNEAAVRLMNELGVPVDDLFAVASRLDESAWSDGTHLYTPAGREALSAAVCNEIEAQLHPFGTEKTVFLLGDSIRMGYGLRVRENLSGCAAVYFSPDNGRFAAYTMRYLAEWIANECEPEQVDAVHFNVGLWDVLCQDGEEPNTPLDEYLRALQRIVDRLRRHCPNAKLIFATTTPVLEEKYDRQQEFGRRNADIERYNEAAVRLMKENGVAVNDLYAVAVALDPQAHSDATHFDTEAGTEALAQAVSKSILAVI